ncbi:MAG: small multi-drug export protein [Clostridia bacterium]|nr:small multi-drug export protein [Clostridia bacterium]
MGEILTAIFGSNSALATVCVAMLPLLELKGAIPLGVSAQLWGAAALNTWQAFGWALLGSSLVVPIIALLFTPIYNWLKTKKFFKTILDFIVGDVAKRSDDMKAENKNKSAGRVLWLKIAAIFLFVAFPVPLTGVWTGTCFAVLLGLNFWVTCATVIAGNAVCGVIVTFVCQVFPQITDILFIVFVGLILVAVLAKVVSHIIKKRRATHESNTTEAN